MQVDEILKKSILQKNHNILLFQNLQIRIVESDNEVIKNLYQHYSREGLIFELRFDAEWLKITWNCIVA